MNVRSVAAWDRKPATSEGGTDLAARSELKVRYWFEAGLAVAAIILAIMTMIWPNWIEILFKIDPDEGSGALELSVVVGLLGVSIASMLLAGRDWRRARMRAPDPS
jgi:hypothetical protein